MIETTGPDPQYYLAIDGQTLGPWQLPDIAQRLASGELPDATLLWDGTVWCAWQDFAPLVQLRAELFGTVAESGVAVESEFVLPTVAAAESAPEAAAAGVVALPVLPVCLPQPRAEVLLPDWYRQDTATETVRQRGVRQYCAAFRMAWSRGPVVEFIPWLAIAPAIIAAALFGYAGKLYMVLTIGSGFAVGLGLFLCVRVSWQYRLVLGLCALAAGGGAWWLRLGI